MLRDYKKATIFSVIIGLSLSCEKKEDGKDDNSVPIVVTALNLDSTMIASASALALLGAGGPKDPNYASGEYDGMGVSTSDAVIETFKVTLTGVTFASATITAGELTVPASDAELDISEGVNKPITITGTIPKGKWDRVTIGVKPEYKLKAYAYMDSNNDGTTDTTVFTTATEVKKSSGRLTATDLAAAGYATYNYKFMYTFCSETPTGSTSSNCGTGVVFPEPFSTEEPPVDELGETRADNTYEVTLLIDSTKVVKAWTGESGNFQMNGSQPSTTVLGNPSLIPQASAGFPLSDVCSDTKNANGYNNCDFFPFGKPAFKMNYLPGFAFLGTKSLSSQVYAASTEAGSWNHYNTGFIEVVLSNGEPLFGRVFTTTDWRMDQTVTPWKVISSAAPVLGSVVRLFEKNSDTYTFHLDYGAKDANGVNDGGLYYNNDKSMAGHIGSGFKLTAVNETGTLTVKNGPRCKDEYDTCVGDRTYYMKRIK
jgi:hypothetical protein